MQALTDPVSPRPAPGIPRGFLLLTAVLSGALVMVVEVLGSRVIGPFFGVSLFVWTSLITVTLVSLALGYALGGRLADRHASPDVLYGLLLLAGLCVLAIPLIKAPVLKLCLPLGLRLGALLSTGLLFGPPLFLLGCVSPYLVKIAVQEMRSIGRLVGGLYALSTVGSVLGTLLTGFVLIAWLGVNRIFQLVGVSLLLLSLCHFLLFRRRWQAAAVLLLPLLLWAAQPAPATSATLANGTRVTLLASRDSHYGQLKVLEYRYGAVRTRELLIDGLIQGGVDPDTGLSIYPYSYFLSFLPWALQPGIGNCLVIGLGAGVVPDWFAARGVPVDVVDIDPEVFAFAREWFGYRDSGTAFQQDARYFLQQYPGRYDVIVVDVFNGDTTPAHLLSLEALQLLRRRLAPGGIVAINLVGDVREQTYMTASALHTLAQVFDQVEVYPTFEPGPGNAVGNLAVLAYAGEPREPDWGRIAGFDIHRLAREDVLGNLSRRFAFPAGTPAMVLRDDYNPVDFHDSGVRELVRQRILQETDWDLLAL